MWVVITSHLIMHKEINAVCSDTDTEHINSMCGQNVEMFDVKPGGT
jgi:hypothetical protein